jgi:hypothetical protein
MRAKKVFQVSEGIKDVLAPPTKETITQAIIQKINRYKIDPGTDIFQRAKNFQNKDKKDGAFRLKSLRRIKLLNYVDKHYFKVAYLVPYKSELRTALHQISVFFKYTQVPAPDEWNIYKYKDVEAITAISQLSQSWKNEEIFLFGESFFNDFLKVAKKN